MGLELNNDIAEFEKVKKLFAEKYDTEDELKLQIDAIEKKIKCYKFNPETRSLEKMHSMIDETQIVNTELFKIKRTILRFKLKSKLFLEDIKLKYEQRSDIELSNIKGDKENFSNAGEKTSHVRKKLKENGAQKYLNFANKKEMTAKSLLDEIETLISANIAIRQDLYEKISLAKLQKDLGVLVTLTKGEQ